MRMFVTLIAGFLVLVGCQPRATHSADAHVASAAAPSAVPASAPSNSPTSSIEIGFSPHGQGEPDCTQMVTGLIQGAKTSVRVQAYSFTSEPIAQALIDAKARNVDVAVLLDKSDVTGKGTKLGMLQAAQVPTFIDSKHAIAHNKVLIVDGVSVETGSFNFTDSAENRNAENCLILRNMPEKASTYTANWEIHKGHSALPKSAP